MGGKIAEKRGKVRNIIEKKGIEIRERIAENRRQVRI